MRISAKLLRFLACGSFVANAAYGQQNHSLPHIQVAPNHHDFETERGQPFVPFGVSYYRPGQGWAPQLWKKFDPELTRKDFARMKELGVNCVRVFLTYGSFLEKPDHVSAEGFAKFDQF